MSWRDPFEILGIARTGDTTDIRRAYARKLKVTNPEDDAEAFQALRAAYEHALAMAPHVGADDDDDDGMQDEPMAEAAWNAPSDAFDASEPAYEREAAARAEPESTLPWGAPRPPADHVSRAEIDDLNAAITRLGDLLQAPEVDRETARDALRAVLAQPAMDAMEVRDQVEHNIGVMVLNAGRNAAFMIDAATEAFDWDSDRLRARTPIGQAVLERREGLMLLRSLQNGRPDVNGAWKALSQKPKGLRLVLNRMTMGLPRQVRQVLETVEREHPWLEDEFDPDALAWWRRFLAAPQVGPVALWSAFALPFVATPVVAALWSFGETDTEAYRAAYPVSVLGMVGLIAVGFGLLRLQALWRRRRVYGASISERMAWAPLALAGMAGAAVTPSPVGWAFATLALLAMVWAVVTAEDGDGPDGVDVVWTFPAAVIPIWQIPIHMPRWLYRTLGLFGLVVLSFVVREMAPGLTWMPVVAAGAAAATAFVLGHFTLEHAWRRLPPMARTVSLGAAAAAVGLLPLWLWSTAPEVGWAPLGFAAIAGPFLLERVASLGEAPNRLRSLLYGWGWLPAVLFADLADVEIRHGNAALLAAGLWLLSVVAVGLVVALRRERTIRAQAYA